MKIALRTGLPLAALLSLGGCNLTYDREAVKFEPPISCSAPTQACGATCVNTFDDANNCGACGHSCGAATCWAGQCGTTVAKLVVNAAYPANGSGWNDWVESAGAPTDNPCLPATGANCVHGGERRVVVVSGQSDCTTVTLTETLGAFDWACSPTLTTPPAVAFRTTGLKATKGLGDLVQVSGGVASWRPNWVTVTLNGAAPTTIGASDPLVPWWPTTRNTLSKVIGPVLGGPGTIYVADGTVQAQLTVADSRVALVVPRGVKLAPAVTSPTAEIVKADAISLSAMPRDFLWFEGEIDAGASAGGIGLDGTRYAVVRGVRVTRAASVPGTSSRGVRVTGGTRNEVREVEAIGTDVGVLIDGPSSQLNRVSGAHVAGVSDTGVLLNLAPNNWVDRVAVQRALKRGVGVVGASGNKLSNLSLFDCGVGLSIEGPSMNNDVFAVLAAQSQRAGISVDTGAALKAQNVLKGLLVVNNRGDGVVTSNTGGNVLGMITAVGNDGCGVNLLNTTQSAVLSLVATGNHDGLCLTNQGGNLVSDAALVRSKAAGLLANGSPSNRVYGKLLFGNNLAGDCVLAGPAADPGFSSTCMPSPTLSAYTYAQNVSLDASFFGRVIVDDASNASDVNGGATLTNYLDPAFDWSTFANPLRLWEGEGGERIGCSAYGIWDSGACLPPATWTPQARIWDWSLLKTDGLIRDVLPAKATAPTTASALSFDLGGGPVNFVPEAIELTGNGNGLCDSLDGACLHVANYGAYQGNGAAAVEATLTPWSTKLYFFPPGTNGN